MTRKRNQQGLIIVYTGHGKGKTSASLGIVLRCWGRGMRVSMLQFIKKKSLKSGEHLAIAKMDGIEIMPLGDGFTWLSENLEIDKALAQQGWEMCKERLSDPNLDVVILDEITYCFHFGWLRVEDVLEAVAQRPAGMHVVLTGRDAPEALVAQADLVSEMKEIRHPFTKGVPPQKGIDL